MGGTKKAPWILESERPLDIPKVGIWQEDLTPPPRIPFHDLRANHVPLHHPETDIKFKWDVWVYGDTRSMPGETQCIHPTWIPPPKLGRTYIYILTHTHTHTHTDDAKLHSCRAAESCLPASLPACLPAGGNELTNTPARPHSHPPAQSREPSPGEPGRDVVPARQTNGDGHFPF